MKWLLTFNIYFAAAGILSAADPSMPPMGTLPYPNPGMATMPTVPQPVLSGTTSWNGDGFQTCDRGAPPKRSLSAFDRLCEWISFRPCPPVHSMCVPEPRRAPLRSFFHNSACGVGCANATDCGNGCGSGRRGNCGGSQDSVDIPMPKRMCASAKCGGSPVWGSNSCGGSGGSVLSRMMGCFGLSGGNTGGGCGGKSNCAGIGGCSSCQYSKAPMSDIGQYHNFTATQSVGLVSSLSSVGAAPAGAHYANPYRATSAELQYQSTPGATLAPAQTVPQGTNPFPGPQGTLPYSRPFTNQ